MENEIQLTVVTPVYNAEKYIDRCISSIVKQDGINLELILINDGSEDRSGEMCDAWAAKYDNIRVYHTENSGPARARNLGMDKSKGKYLGFVDADDYIELNMYKFMVDRAEKDKLEIVVCGFDEIYDGRVVSVKHPEIADGNLIGEKEIKETALGKYYTDNAGTWPSLCNKIYRRDFINCNNIRINEELIRAEDYWFNFDLLCKAQRIGGIDKPLYHYMQDNPNSTMHSIRENQYDEWKNTRRELLIRNKELKIEYNNASFANGFLYNTAVYLRGLSAEGKREKMNEILKDNFYHETIKQGTKLPIHIRLIQKAIIYRLYPVARGLLHIWGR